MKKTQPRTERKLPLRKETVRTIEQLDLGHVVGGNVTSTVQKTHIVC